MELKEVHQLSTHEAVALLLLDNFDKYKKFKGNQPQHDDANLQPSSKRALFSTPAKTPKSPSFASSPIMASGGLTSQSDVSEYEFGAQFSDIDDERTGSLENFNSVILMCASKRYAFRYPSYRARNYLAMIDHNRHLDKPYAAKKKDGQPMYQRMCHKQNKNWSACRKKEKKTYKYVPEIVERIVNMRLDDEQSSYRRAERGEHDPRNIASNIMNTGPVPVPSTSEIVQKQRSRFH
ncbi:hypothetical protein LSAT2_005587 [Lamellibrachia satsuma]|nr:hypothetical protein LSAT2_005587 [Lamellibrachia satsuma]